MFDAFRDSTVIYEDGNLIQRRMAYRISRVLSVRTGVPVGFGTASEEKPWLLMSDDPTLKKGDWRVCVRDSRVTFCANGYYGYTGIVRFLESDEATDFYVLADGYERTGSYLDTVSVDRFADSTRYAYQKMGDVRIMFNNVLWENPMPALRNPLVAEMVAQYLPDVLGCQEFNTSKRMRAGDQDLSLLLAKKGYVEAIDPRVPNADTVENGGFGVKSPKAGKWPWLDADLVTVAGKTYYTVYNCTPLFYNPATTRCVDGGFLWFADQRDEENAPGDSMDFGSKSATWGLFEDIRTEKRYVVISTHMCTRSNGVKKKQAIEMVALIDRLVSQYQCPVFLGGDYNSTWAQPNYQHFREMGYADLARDGIAELGHSELRTHHTYPVYDEALDMMQPAENDNTVFSPEGRIDHIMLANGGGVRVRLHGTVVDECTMSASDHYPVFTDINL